MLLPLGDNLGISVELSCATTDPPLFTRARLTRFDGARCTLEIDPGPLELGARVVVTPERPGGLRLLGAVTEVAGGSLEFEVIRLTRTDKRDYPRMWGGIQLRYRVFEPRDPKAEQAWLSGLSVVDESPWHRPHPFMNFSGCGIRFEDDAPAAVGDFVLIELEVPTSPRAHRATGRVVRADDAEHLESGKSRIIAVQFAAMDEGGAHALTEFTLARQLEEMGIDP